MQPDNEEDLALSRRSASGDSAAFAMLVEKHERRLRAFLAKAVGPDHCDDIAQEAFLKAWRASAQYDGRARYSTWLTSIAWRCRLDTLRRRHTVSEQAESISPSLEGAFEVDDMLSRLGETERVALILCEGHGWTHAETAQMLGVPLGTLKSTVARAKAKCRAMWRGGPQ